MKKGESFSELFRLEVALIDGRAMAVKKKMTVFLAKLSSDNFTIYGYTMCYNATYGVTVTYIEVVGESYVVPLMSASLFPSKTNAFKSVKYVGKNCVAYVKYMSDVGEDGELESRNEFAYMALKKNKKEYISKAMNVDKLTKDEARVNFSIQKDLFL